MKTDKIFWGIIFVFIGSIFLMENFGIIDFSWRNVWRFWPIILIISGLNIIFSRSSNKAGLFVVVAITVISLGFVAFMGFNDAKERKSNWTFNLDDDDDEWDNGENNLQSSSNSTAYSEDFNSSYKYANLTISGGASSFKIESGDDKLFETQMFKENNRYFLKKTESDSTVNLNLSSKNKNNSIKFGDKDFGDIDMQLHTYPIWEVDLKMGAGKTDFDFSKNKVKSIKLKGGAASFNVKVGDLLDDVEINAETGVAEVKIEVPESMGCEITTSTGLSAKDFKGFEKLGDGSYRTANFNKTNKKVHISLKGGLSDFEVSRY